MFKATPTRLFFVLGIALIFSACGRDQDDSQVSETNKKPLFVSMGGNTSCQTDDQRRAYSPYATSMYLYANAYVWGPKASPNQEWNFVATCHTSEATVYHLSTQEPNKVRASHREDFQEWIKQLGKDSSGVYLAGHSYGGWLAMKTALALSEDEEYRNIPVYLYTVDPISRVHCSFATPGGCRAAPQDFNKTQRERIAEQTTAWHNFYQTNTWYLHSSEIDLADENREIDTSHSNIDSSRTVWEQIRDNVRSQQRATASTSLLVYQ